MLNLGQKVMYKGIETKIIGVDKSDMALRKYAIGYVDPSLLAVSHDFNIKDFDKRLRDFEYLEGEPNGHTWVMASEVKEIAKPKAVKVNLDNIMEVGKWFMELTGKDFGSRGLKFYKDILMDRSYGYKNIYLLESSSNNDLHYNGDKTMDNPDIRSKFDIIEYRIVEYKKEDKGMRFEREGFEFRGWKLGEEVMYDGEKTKIVGFDLGYTDGGSIVVAYEDGWDFETAPCKNNANNPVFINGVKGNCYWVLEKWLTKITPETTKIYSFAELHGKKSACGNFFIEATPTLIKVFTKTTTRDSVGVFQVGRTSKLNTLADLTNFGFELYELVEFELSEYTRKKFAGFGDKKVCRLASIGDVWFVRVYHDGKDGQYDTISLTKEDKINKADFLVEEVK